MLLVNAQVTSFRSIDQSGKVAIDPKITVLVGQNESGKTAFLHAMNLSHSLSDSGGFDIDRDYPRKGVNEYRKRHEDEPEAVTLLTYELTQPEVASINKAMGFELFKNFQFSIRHNYNNGRTILIELEEGAYVHHLIKNSKLPADIRSACEKIKTIRELIEALTGKDLNTEGDEFLAKLKTRFTPKGDEWNRLLHYELYFKYLAPLVPKFFYFDDYYLLPGKINLQSLAAIASEPKQQKEGDKTALSLLRLADVDLTDLTATQSYEQIKSRLEGLSNSITDRIFEYWTQNKELDVEFDIRTDSKDTAPFNSGPNLYIRIKNKRHRVTVPFSQRSKGFIWFFSFIVWFDTIKQSLVKNEPLVLLLDEPGLSLHALAQADFLRYIDELARQGHQIIYTTHSPFMIHSDRLEQVRVVEDRKTAGSVVTSNLSGSDPKTIFPLQAALGYTIAQNLFISKRNLLVEGPADLVYLKLLSTYLEKADRPALRESITIVPTGGLDKVATFISLLGANQLELVVLHDWANKPDPRIEALVREKIIKDKFVTNYGQFRSAGTGSASASTPPATDVEDLFSVGFYLSQFSATFKAGLGGKQITEADLPPGDRIVDRLNRYLADNAIQVRPSGGFNHYAVATHIAANPPKTFDKETLGRFEDLFKAMNKLFSSADD